MKCRDGLKLILAVGLLFPLASSANIICRATQQKIKKMQGDEKAPAVEIPLKSDRDEFGKYFDGSVGDYQILIKIDKTQTINIHVRNNNISDRALCRRPSLGNQPNHPDYGREECLTSENVSGGLDRLGRGPLLTFQYDNSSKEYFPDGYISTLLKITCNDSKVTEWF